MLSSLLWESPKDGLELEFVKDESLFLVDFFLRTEVLSLVGTVEAGYSVLDEEVFFVLFGFRDEFSCLSLLLNDSSGFLLALPSNLALLEFE